MGDAGFEWQPTRTPLVDRVINVDPASSAASAGIRNGDLVDTRLLNPVLRIRWYTSVRYGIPAQEVVTLPVMSGHMLRTLSFTPSHRTFSWDECLELAGFLWMLGFAGLLAWRRPESAEARALCLFLILIPAAIALTYLTLPNLTVQIALNIVGGLCYLPSIPMLAVYAMLFQRPPNSVRSALAWLSYISELAATGSWLALWPMYWTAALDPTGFLTAQTVLALLTLVFPLLCACETIAVARGAERSRIVWTTLTLGFVYVTFFLFNALLLFPQLATGTGRHFVFELTRVALFIAPIGMTYALFNRRLLDVGFALNRATIFAGVSLVLVGVVVLVEWLLSNWLQGASHSANLAVTGALALGLGLSIRFVHARVEHVVDNVFFHKRRADEEAIRTMAAEAPYITERSVLLARTESTLSKYADAAFAGLLLDDGAGTCGGVNENDPALVALRARHERVDLHALETAIDGEYAYPMVARGQLVGALVLGPKRSGEAYAPDESQAIQQLAYSVAAALDVIALKNEGERDAILDALRDLPQRLVEALDARKQLAR